MNESEEAVNKVIANLNRIPKEIDTKILVKDLVKEISADLQKNMRGRVSYT
jgi:hypothetical protein